MGVSFQDLQQRWKKPGHSGHDADVQDSARVEQLFRDHAGQVLAYALRRTDPATADDVVAEVFVIVWRRIDRVPQEQPVLWLYSVARRVLSNQRRSVRRRAALEEGLRPLVSDRSDPQDGQLLEALTAMTQVDREVLLLTVWEDLQPAQVALVLGCSAQAVYGRLHRARKRLAEDLGLPESRAVKSVSETRNH